MKPRQQFLLLPLYVVLLTCTGCAALQAQSDQVAKKVDELLEQVIDPDSPGAAVAVVHNDEIVFKQGYGLANMEYDIPITPSTVFHVASVSKQFTAFAILLLEQQGKLSLDDDIRTHLPEVPDFGHAITIRHLIHHTSGLRDQWELLMLAGWRLDDVITQQHIMRMVARQRDLNFEPGTEYLYSNTGYTLLAEIVSRAGGDSFPQWTQKNIFEPLGMTFTHFHDDHEHIVPGRAYSYTPDPRGGYKKSVLNYANAGATSLFTTVEDLAKWMLNFASGQIGGQPLIEKMHERGHLSSGDTLSYGFALIHNELRGVKMIHHGGADAGYRSFAVQFPEQDLGIVVLSNSRIFNSALVAQLIAGFYLPEESVSRSASSRPGSPADRQARNDPGLSGSGSLTQAPLSDYKGRYYSHELGTIYHLTVKDDRLVIEHHRQEDMILTASGEDRFDVSVHGYLGRLPPGHFTIRFDRDENGEVSDLYLDSRRVRNLHFERMGQVN